MIFLTKTKMLDPKYVSTPADPSTMLVLSGDPFHDPKLYIQIVGSLQYATITRPEIAYAINHAFQFMHVPTSLHWQSVKHILRYMNDTMHHCLHFTPHNTYCLLAYSDSRRLSESDDSRSQYGFAVFHGPNLISCTSRKQHVVARSSIKEEYRALAYTTIELLWIQQLL